MDNFKEVLAPGDIIYCHDRDDRELVAAALLGSGYLFEVDDLRIEITDMQSGKPRTDEEEELVEKAVEEATVKTLDFMVEIGGIGVENNVDLDDLFAYVQKLVRNQISEVHKLIGRKCS